MLASESERVRVVCACGRTVVGRLLFDIVLKRCDPNRYPRKIAAATAKSTGLSNIAYPTLAVGINDGIHGTHRAVH